MNTAIPMADGSIHKISKDHSVAVSQTKNNHIYLYLVTVKVKNEVVYRWID